MIMKMIWWCLSCGTIITVNSSEALSSFILRKEDLLSWICQGMVPLPLKLDQWFSSKWEKRMRADNKDGQCIS